MAAAAVPLHQHPRTPAIQPALHRQHLLPGLAVTATKTAATVLDDGFGVKATLKGGGHTVATSAAGKAKLVVFKRGTRITVTAAGYAPASFKRP